VQANSALSTGRRCRHTNTHILDVPLASVWGYIDRRTGRVALLLYLIQRVLEVGTAVHHVGSGKKVSQKTWKSGCGLNWLVSRADGVSSRGIVEYRCITYRKLSNLVSGHSRSQSVERTVQGG
jgi:hypothetical protein